MTNCVKCNNKCVPIYNLCNSPDYKQYVCRDCAFKIMEGYYDRRSIETKETD